MSLCHIGRKTLHALPMAESELSVPIDQLIACPQCDALHRAEPPDAGERALCSRCGTVLISPRSGAYLRVLALAITVMILMIGATFFPFLELRVAGLRADSSLFDVARVFAAGGTAPLVVAVAALIIVIPVMRVALIAYVLGPIAIGRSPPRHAAPAFRLSEDLKPWSMAEIFVIGVAVALVKLADLARVDFGPAFWLFSALVVITVLQDGFMCRWTLWSLLERERRG